jgi:hypothetical protein
MKRTHPVKFLAALVAGLVLAACANQQEPAKKLLGDVEAAITAAGADAQQYAPEQAASVNQKLADLKAAFDKQDYQTVITGGPALLAEAKGLADSAAAKKKEALEALNTQWTALSASVPQQVAAIEAQLTTIAKTKKLPKGVTKDGVAAAKAGLGELKSGWSEATTSFGAGNLQAALDKAKGVKAKADEMAAALGVTTGATAKPAA